MTSTRNKGTHYGTAAREQAKALRRIIDDGGDPLGEREAGMVAPRIPDLIDRYIETHTPNLAPNNRADQISMLRKLVQPVWKHKLVEDITLDDVDRLLSDVAKGRSRPSKTKPNNRARKLQGSKPTPIRANRTGEVLRKMFNLAVQWKLRPDNPAAGFHRRIETERERYLSMDEIDRLPSWWQGRPARAHVRRWIDDLGLTEGRIIEIAAETRGDHPNPPDGPKALDRFMERAAQRDAQTATDTAKSRKRKQARNADNAPRLGPEELAVFYAELVNSDKYLPASMISNVMRDTMLARGLVTPDRLRMRGVR